MLLLALAACEIEAEKPAGAVVADTGTPDTDTAPDDTACAPVSYWSDLDGDTFGDAANVIEACDAPAGYVANADDCNDADGAISPAGTETCDGVDQDCDGSTDEEATDATVWYPDRDRDGLGADAEAVTACEQPTDYISVGGDCDDYDRSTGGGASWYADADEDGWGAEESVACAQPEGHVALAGDCDDARADTHPDAAEVCDDLDQDCDGALDEDAVDVVSWYPDRDADGYGAGEATVACVAPADHADNADDCDDTSASISPGATETCSGLDEDCDALVDADDPDMSGLATWYLDADGDDHGDPATSFASCTRPEGYALDPDDCDDTDATVFPGADETCDGTDEDCDATVDDNAIDAATWYADGDDDGFGDVGSLACEAPAGTVAVDGDCDDGDDAVHPDANEACDTIDNDCDGATDEGEWYADDDGDTYGDPDAFDTSCVAPSGFVADASDCDDTSATVSPASTEHCDDVDEDCDGSVDDDAVDPSDWYADGDGDTYGAGTAVAACDAPPGHVADATDCDDTLATISPIADEHCDEVDEDCDGLADDGAIDPSDWYADGDGDGYGAGTATSACDAPVGSVDNADDCDDTLATVSPAAYETCSDGIDQDCDGTDATVCDVDGDGYDVSTDCDDDDPEVNPGEKEVCDAGDVDEDCDGVADNDDLSASTATKTRHYEDADGDGYGEPGGSLKCDAPAGYVDNDEDCDDADDTISPDAADICASGVDEDCSGEVDDCMQYDADDAALHLSAEGDIYGYFGRSVAAGDFGTTAILIGDSEGYGSVGIFDPTLRGDLSQSAMFDYFVNSGWASNIGEAIFVADTDADGLDDAAMGSSVVYGSDVLDGGDIGTEALATLPGSPLGWVDINGDSSADIQTTMYSGSYFVGVILGPVFGSYGASDTDALVEFGSGALNTYATGVDFDGDGSDSLIVSDGYTVFVLHDPLSGSSTSDADYAYTGEQRAGLCIVGADTDADGYEEVAFSDTGSTEGGTTAWLVPTPSTSGTGADDASATLVVTSYSYVHGYYACSSGDLDGDGKDEVSFADRHGGGTDVSSIYILDDWSGAVDIADLSDPGVGALIEDDGTQKIGYSLVDAGDTDADGTDDLLVGATGQAWLFLGSDLFP